jgi:hypothetical protein
VRQGAVFMKGKDKMKEKMEDVKNSNYNTNGAYEIAEKAIVERTEREKLDLCDACWIRFVWNCEQFEKMYRPFRVAEHEWDGSGLFPEEITDWINETFSNTALIEEYGVSEDDCDELRSESESIFYQFLRKCWENYEWAVIQTNADHKNELAKLRENIYCVIPTLSHSNN